MKLPSCSSLLGLLALAGLVACSAAIGWTKKGANQDDLREAQRECRHQASQYSFVDTSFYDGMEQTRDSSATADIYRTCMEAQGWHRGPLNQPPTAQAPR
jgi:hypothetical protein